jgi:peptide/nickel transport system permease protein
MARMILVRIAHAILTMLLLVTLVFFMVRLTGDPTRSLIAQDAPPELRQRLRAEFGLDQPVTIQFAAYVVKLAQGDLGESFRGRVPVSELIARRVPATLSLALPALLLVIAVGLPLGVYAAYWRGGRVDRIARGIAVFGQATPSFTIALILILTFAVNLRVLPAGGTGGIEYLILPALTIAFAAIAGLVRLLRSSMIEVLETEYVTFHRMKGLPERTILWKHGLRNAGLTTLSYLGLVTAGLITGSVIAETIFAWPGIGRLMIEGVEYRDFPVVQGVVLLFSFVYITMNLIIDILYLVLNPRLR